MKKSIALIVTVALLCTNAGTAFGAVPEIEGVPEDYVQYDYTPVAGIDRADVPIKVAPTTMPAGMDSIVVKTYPQGRLRALVMDWDDGGSNYGTYADTEYVIPLLKRHGLKASFNLYSPDNAERSTYNVNFGKIDGVNNTYSGNYDGYVRLLNQQYNYPDFSAEGHTINHPTLPNCTYAKFQYELAESKRHFETVLQKEISGFAYPGGSNTNTAEAWLTDSIRQQYIEWLGYRYSRNAPAWTGTTSGGTGGVFKPNFEIPASFFKWNPTFDVSANVKIDPIGHVVSASEVLQSLLDLDCKNQMKVFYAWGHAWVARNNFANLTNMCQLLKDNLDKVWNPTVIQFVDYVNASRNLQVTYTANGDISIHNPAKPVTDGRTTVWVRILGHDTPIAPGQTILVDNQSIRHEAASYVASMDGKFQVNGQTISDLGTMNFNTSVSSTLTGVNPDGDEYGNIQINQTAATDQDYLVLDDPWLLNVDKTTVVDVAYRVKLNSYDGAAPEVKLGLALPSVALMGGNRLFTRGIAPQLQKEDVVHTAKFIIDPTTKRAYLSDNGGEMTSLSFPFHVAVVRDIRLYFATLQEGGLSSPVTWTIDSIRVHQPIEEDLLKLYAAKVKEELGAIAYDVRVKNYAPVNRDIFLITALYHKDVMVNMTSTLIENVQPQFVEQRTGLLGLPDDATEYVLKHFIWDGYDKLIPYDSIAIDQSVVRAAQ